MIKPEQIKDIDFKALVKQCQTYLDWFDSDDYYEDGIEPYETAIAESAMMLVFGKDVYDYINTKIV